MITKTQLNQAIDKLPEKFTIDELLDRGILIDKIERGNKQTEKGETVSEEELALELVKLFN